MAAAGAAQEQPAWQVCVAAAAAGGLGRQAQHSRVATAAPGEAGLRGTPAAADGDARRVGAGEVDDKRGFLFRGGHTHTHMCEYTPNGAQCSMSANQTAGYKAMLVMMRRALQECYGYSEDRSEERGERREKR